MLTDEELKLKLELGCIICEGTGSLGHQGECFACRGSGEDLEALDEITRRGRAKRVEAKSIEGDG
jgi:hypothetical protein